MEDERDKGTVSGRDNYIGDVNEANDMLDLNPTAFVDDVYNAVEVHCATGFEELDSALRRELASELSPEQLTVLLQGTAGLYQDLRVEIRKRLRTFEEYALAEILKLPPGLLADPEGLEGRIDHIDEAEEASVDEELKLLQREVADMKQKGRDMQASMTMLDKLMEDLTKHVAELESVPNVLGSTETLVQDVRYVTEKSVAVEEGCMKLDALHGAVDSVHADEEMLAAIAKGKGKDQDLEKHVLAHHSSLKQAAADDLRAFRESLIQKNSR